MRRFARHSATTRALISDYFDNARCFDESKSAESAAADHRSRTVSSYIANVTEPRLARAQFLLFAARINRIAAITSRSRAHDNRSNWTTIISLSPNDVRQSKDLSFHLPAYYLKIRAHDVRDRPHLPVLRIALAPN